MNQKKPILPQGFTKGLSKFGGLFLGGVWQGMGPNPMERNVKKPEEESRGPRPKVDPRRYRRR